MTSESSMNGDPEVLGTEPLTADEEATVRGEHHMAEYIDGCVCGEVDCDRFRLLATLDVARDSRPVGEAALAEALDAGDALNLAGGSRNAQPLDPEHPGPSARQRWFGASSAWFSVSTRLRASLQAGPAAVRPVEREGLRDRIAAAIWAGNPEWETYRFVCTCDPDAMCWPHEEADIVLSSAPPDTTNDKVAE